MKALLLAAGFGTRLRSLTEKIPKCLVPIKGKPLLQIWLERLEEAGITSFLVNTHYLSENVFQFINKSKYQDKVTLVYESELLGTAGTLIVNLGFFEGQDALLIHADNYCLADFKAFIQAHHTRPVKCLMTMMTFKTDNPSSCGVVELDEQGIVVAFHEKKISPHGNLANGAVYILSSECLSYIVREFSSATDFSTEIIPHMVGRIFSYQTHEIFLDVGTPTMYALANNIKN